MKARWLVIVTFFNWQKWATICGGRVENHKLVKTIHTSPTSFRAVLGHGSRTGAKVRTARLTRSLFVERQWFCKQSASWHSRVAHFVLLHSLVIALSRLFTLITQHGVFLPLFLSRFSYSSQTLTPVNHKRSSALFFVARPRVCASSFVTRVSCSWHRACVTQPIRQTLSSALCHAFVRLSFSFQWFAFLYN